MRFSEIRKTGKAVLVDMSRRRSSAWMNVFGLESFKQAASQKWVKGVVIDRVKGKSSSHYVVAVNQNLIDEALSLTGDAITQLCKKYEEDVDYRIFRFSRGFGNDSVLNEKADIYYRSESDEKVKAAIDQEKGVIKLLRKDVEEWTDADVQTFYHYIMVCNFKYNPTPDETIKGNAVGEVVRHARHLFGIYQLASRQDETFDEYYARNRRATTEIYYPRLTAEEKVINGILEDAPESTLKKLFDDYCDISDAHKGAIIECILDRRHSMAASVVCAAQEKIRDENKIRSLDNFFFDYATNPDEETRKRFVIYKKTWE